VLTSVVAVVSIVALVLPGFIALRVASGRRAQPTTIGDLELVLRALGYALFIHLLFVAIGWTPALVHRLSNPDKWADHRLEIVGFASAIVVTAVLLGALMGWTLRRLVTRPSPESGWHGVIFHALGGQDSRDAFDYVFERRKRETNNDFMVIVRTDGGDGDRDGVYVGRYGANSYFGLTPRPHDLYLEEMWKWDDSNDLVKQTLHHGAWFRAEAIKDLDFRELPHDEKTIQRTASFGSTRPETSEAASPDTTSDDLAARETASYRVLESYYVWDLVSKDGREAEFEKRIRLRSLVDDLATITDSHWGDGVVERSESSPGEVIRTFRVGPADSTVIMLDRALQSGDETELTIHRTLRDAFTNPSEWVEVDSAKTGRATVRVVFPLTRPPKRARLRRAGDRWEKVIPQTTADGRVVLEFVADEPVAGEPVPGERYSLLWDW
jgi:hypothetical protein